MREPCTDDAMGAASRTTHGLRGYDVRAGLERDVKQRVDHFIAGRACRAVRLQRQGAAGLADHATCEALAVCVRRFSRDGCIDQKLQVNLIVSIAMIE